MKSPLKLLIGGIVIGGALVFVGALLVGVSVNVSTVVSESHATGSGRYTLSVDTSTGQTKYIVLDTESGLARVFTDTGVLFETRMPEEQAAAK